MSTTEIRPADIPASPPGRTLRRLLDQQGISQGELARRMGRPYKVVNDIVNARTLVHAEVPQASAQGDWMQIIAGEP